jgi:hypothetical protein
VLDTIQQSDQTLRSLACDAGGPTFAVVAPSKRPVGGSAAAAAANEALPFLRRRCRRLGARSHLQAAYGRSTTSRTARGQSVPGRNGARGASPLGLFDKSRSQMLTGLTDALRRSLREAGLPREQLHEERFVF